MIFTRFEPRFLGLLPIKVMTKVYNTDRVDRVSKNHVKINYVKGQSKEEDIQDQLPDNHLINLMLNILSILCLQRIKYLLLLYEF